MTRRSVVTVTEPAAGMTPWSAFLALDTGGPAVLLESARPDPRVGRYSVVVTHPSAIWHARGDRNEIAERGITRRYRAEPARELRRLLAARRLERHADLPPFAGGAVGWVSYEARSAFEELPTTAVDDLGIPHWWFVFADESLVFDHVANTVTASIAIDRPSERDAARERARNRLRQARGLPKSTLGPVASDGVVNSSFGRSGFTHAVERALEYIAAGDVYQVNLAQRLDLGLRGDPRTLYGVLRAVNPSPFAAFIRAGDVVHVGCSPERLVSLSGSHAETRPIAGTRPRGATEREDDELRAELLLSPKERAEHVMLVDLERNDLGRVCSYGSVRVDELMVLERYSHVNHIVSNVVGSLPPDRDELDLLAAMFPGGTITGCPKIRCMEIIDELEPVARHAYTGSFGYISDTGDMDMNIVIRTVTIAQGRAYIAVGAGIVADSIPEREYDETLDKAEAMLRAIEQASGSKLTGAI